MTLDEWIKKYPDATVGEAKGLTATYRFVLAGGTDPDAVKELWHVDDYAVSSQTGTVIWLVPKQ
jgi:hypothetical protein